MGQEGLQVIHRCQEQVRGELGGQEGLQVIHRSQEQVQEEL